MTESSLFNKYGITPRWGLGRAAFDLENIKAFAPGEWQELSSTDFSLTTSELRIVLSRTRFNRYAAFVYILESALMDSSEPVLWFHKENLDWRESLHSVIAGVREGIVGFPEIPAGLPVGTPEKE